MRTVCDVYRSPREEEMYLYVDKREGIAHVPEKLLELFGRPRHLMTMLLTPEKKLARAEADGILKEIRERGYYLQMPPARDDEMRAIAAQNSKLQR
ncbi:YcgL domain-containing protein [Microbulbifer halophilus]|uniref:YcgL domain-containing protein ACFSKX_06305 n=1 Tax=Microbulbifer halophilus TaxID=453963 RepID=A0ABW5E9P3_9GAMM|nr:YcgL domain-containing protein [Microbulbifer halophilus]MCW8125009.1 YcgL domain-containing protein [Microbulbifer halophilus]